MRYQSILKLYNLFVLNGQVFYDLTTEDADPTFGYLVADPETQYSTGNLTILELQDYLSTFKRKIKNNVYLSIHYETPTEVRLCFYNLVMDEKTAILIGHVRSLDSIWDNANQNEYEIHEFI